MKLGTSSNFPPITTLSRYSTTTAHYRHHLLLAIAVVLASTTGTLNASAQALSYECMIDKEIQTKFLVSREIGRAIWLSPSEKKEGEIHGLIGEARVDDGKTHIALPYFAEPYLSIEIDRHSRRAVVHGEQASAECSEHVVAEFPRPKLKRSQQVIEVACSKPDEPQVRTHITLDSSKSEWTAQTGNSRSTGRIGRNDSYSIDICIPQQSECTSRNALRNRDFLQLNLITGDLVDWKKKTGLFDSIENCSVAETTRK